MLRTIQLRDQIWWNTNNIDKFKDGVTLIGQVTLIFANSATRYVFRQLWRCCMMAKQETSYYSPFKHGSRVYCCSSCYQRGDAIVKSYFWSWFPCHNPIIFLCNNQSFNREGREQWDWICNTFGTYGCKYDRIIHSKNN
jgi:hypothetical protein